MSQFYDFYLLLDNSGKIQNLHWSGTECRERHEASWQSCVGRDWDSLAGSQSSHGSGILSWKGIDFRWKRTVFRPQYLPRYCSADAGTEQPSPERRPETGTGTLQEQVAVFEAAVIEDTLRTCRGNISQAARMLGLQRQGLQYRIRKYGIWTE